MALRFYNTLTQQVEPFTPVSYTHLDVYKRQVRLYPQYQRIILIHTDDGPDDAARGHYDLAVFQRLEHLLLLALLPLHRHEHQQVENGHQRQGQQQTHDGVAP